jgi:hypothetical protein
MKTTLLALAALTAACVQLTDSQDTPGAARADAPVPADIAAQLVPKGHKVASLCKTGEPCCLVDVDVKKTDFGYAPDAAGDKHVAYYAQPHRIVDDWAAMNVCEPPIQGCCASADRDGLCTELAGWRGRAVAAVNPGQVEVVRTDVITRRLKLYPSQRCTVKANFCNLTVGKVAGCKVEKPTETVWVTGSYGGTLPVAFEQTIAPVQLERQNDGWSGLAKRALPALVYDKPVPGCNCMAGTVEFPAQATTRTYAWGYPQRATIVDPAAQVVARAACGQPTADHGAFDVEVIGFGPPHVVTDGSAAAWQEGCDVVPGASCGKLELACIDNTPGPTQSRVQ